MAYRKKMSSKKSRKVFKKGAKSTHKKNKVKLVMRGGIRL